MVLSRTSKRGSKPDKFNWVMHRYHFGSDEDEKEGQYVVSKIFYQQHKLTDNCNSSVKLEQSDSCDASLTMDKGDNYDAPFTIKQNGNFDASLTIEEYDIGTSGTSPRTKRVTPNPPCPGETPSFGDAVDDYAIQPSVQGVEFVKEAMNSSSCDAQAKDELDYCTCLAAEPCAADINSMEELLLCSEIIDTTFSSDFGLNGGPFIGFTHNTSHAPQGDGSSACGIAEPENLELDTPSDFQLADLQFSSQDSIFGWLDRL
ncbi:hypothetical protein ACH5RR_008477 [Cinchona calisaya]|uniref:NAC domain-containing protein n=1 Tax=Cinchona calisaya TaxID=153742 RepID=A0ABD3AFB8_9GENT